MGMRLAGIRIGSHAIAISLITRRRRDRATLYLIGRGSYEGHRGRRSLRLPIVESIVDGTAEQLMIAQSLVDHVQLHLQHIACAFQDWLGALCGASLQALHGELLLPQLITHLREHLIERCIVHVAAEL